MLQLCLKYYFASPHSNCAKSYCVSPGLLYPAPASPGAALLREGVQQSKRGAVSLGERAPSWTSLSQELSKAPSDGAVRKNEVADATDTNENCFALAL